jgi:hypothetical protein
VVDQDLDRDQNQNGTAGDVRPFPGDLPESVPDPGPDQRD